MNELIQQLQNSGIILTYESSTSDADIMFIDFNEYGVEVSTEHTRLTKTDSNFKDVYKQYLNKIYKLVVPDNNIPFTVNDIKSIRKLYTKILSMQSSIAVNGRIGPGNFIIMNSILYNLLSKHTSFNRTRTAHVHIDDYIDTHIIVGRVNDSVVQPGIVFVYCVKDKQWNIVDIGFYPEKQYTMFKYNLHLKK